MPGAAVGVQDMAFGISSCMDTTLYLYYDWHELVYPRDRVWAFVHRFASQLEVRKEYQLIFTALHVSFKLGCTLVSALLLTS